MRRSHRRRKIYLVAGEPSGDTLGALLIEALRRQDPEIVCRGVGGPKMAAAGQRQTVDLTEHAVVGLVEVLRHYRGLRKLFHRLLREIEAARPDVVVLIDYPGFNLRLAAAVRRRLPSIKLIYYVSPQVWAWKPGRAELLSKTVDELLVLFPFEEEWYRHRGIPLTVSCVGHPLWDRLLVNQRRERKPGAPMTIGLLPGSRESEIERHLPLLLETAAEMDWRRGNLEFLLVTPDARREAYVRQQWAARGPGPAIRLRVGYALSHLARCDLALLCSGSASLECAAVGTPQLLVYKANPITYAVAKRVVQVRYLSIVNLLADAPVVPELISEKLTSGAIAEAALHLLDHPEERAAMVQAMQAAIEPIARAGASARAAAHVLALADRPCQAREADGSAVGRFPGKRTPEALDDSRVGSLASGGRPSPKSFLLRLAERARLFRSGLVFHPRSESSHTAAVDSYSSGGKPAPGLAPKPICGASATEFVRNGG
ncbi:Lipid-A-disaccharide synthase (modular protein) [Methylacidimicrobium sp. AP8]|uniref:lipid-A-disaccharide synthase n=1 Tax=Methylacidimicrobium sp. AP8 TaxID=2730359 RepID=UPI0018C10AF1|nr:lipid-A-disaccharide synthase [Methylacidimicrobium sp. AP8]CAB4242698.1 Lipid-A-disaccharide synthase (modular protein) [Methylacidimicrobium sp. AP8]